jgi:tellurite resistance protein
MGDDRPTERISLNTLAIPFGLAGLAETWTTFGVVLGLPQGVGRAFWVVTAVAWVGILTAHLRRGRVVGRPLVEQLSHPVQGPVAALVPVVGMLLGAALLPVARGPAEAVIVVGLAASALFLGAFVGRLQSGGVVARDVHGGYFLPSVAAGFVGSYAAALAGWERVAAAAFWVGLLGWLVTLGVLLARLATQPPLPDPLVPTLAILVAPPAVGGLAWFAMQGERIDAVQAGLGATLVVFVVGQLTFVPSYLALGFTLGFWSFTFPYAAVGAYAMLWLDITRPQGWQLMAGALTVAVTVLVLGIGIRSLVWMVHESTWTRGATDRSTTTRAS